MNVPGRPDGNWRWRSSEEMLSDSRFEWLRDLTRKASRAIQIAGGIFETVEHNYTLVLPIPSSNRLVVAVLA